MALFLLTGQSLSQSADKGKIFVDLEGGMAGYVHKSNETHTNSNVAGTVLLGLGVGYNTHENLNVGLELNSQNFLIDSVRQGNFSAQVYSTNLLARFQYHFVNKEKFNMYIGAKIGFSDLNLYAVDSNGVEGNLIMKGTSAGISTGMRKYFGKSFGVKAELGFNTMSLRGDHFEVDGQTETNLNNWLLVEDYKAQFRGLYLTIGLTFKLRNDS